MNDVRGINQPNRNDRVSTHPDNRLSLPNFQTHLVIDIETLDITPNARILEVGCVIFTCSDIGTCISEYVYYAAVPHDGGTESATTRKWHEDNTQCLNSRGTPVSSINSVATYLELLGDIDYVWCWGLDFDIPILRNSCARNGSVFLPQVPYSKFRCLRSVAEFLGVKRIGKVSHNALDDAVQQADVLKECLRIKARNKGGR